MKVVDDVEAGAEAEADVVADGRSTHRVLVAVAVA
jgi:hypothetical protein